MIERMNTRRLLRERDITTLQRSIICKLDAGATMYRSGDRIWLSTAFEAGVPSRTFFALRVKNLIQRVKYSAAQQERDMAALLAGKPDRCKQVRYWLTAKGREWARTEWKP